MLEIFKNGGNGSSDGKSRAVKGVNQDRTLFTLWFKPDPGASGLKIFKIAAG